jgi:hypothetical protein
MPLSGCGVAGAAFGGFTVKFGSLRAAAICGAMTAFASLAAYPAAASTFNYSVSYGINSATITGDIQTNCDNCTLSAANVLSWFFNSSNDLSISSADPGAFVFISGSPSLVASPTSLVFNGGSSNSFIEFCGDAGCETFAIFEDFQGGVLAYLGTVDAQDNFEFPQTPVQVATLSSTPLPSALPLFASGLGALGLLARRRKRKNAA